MRRPVRLEAAFWSAHSRVWDDSLADERVVTHLSEVTDWFAAACAPGTVVADLGCGTGNHTAALRARGMRVIGVDIAPGMLARAREKADDGGVAPALVRADLQHALPLAPGSVDAAISVYSTQFLDLGAFLREVRRVVRPAGVVLVEVPRVDGALLHRRGPSLRLRLFDTVKRVTATAGLALGMVHARTPADMQRALHESGFELIDERTSPRSYAVLARA